ncbi:MAG: OmpA family protein [Fusobacterium sp.]|nr:OmpA family protein [Fusobacterium sp.]
MVRKSTTKIGVLLFLFMLSLSSFAIQKLTTTQMRENTIRINALEIKEADITLPKITIVLDEGALNFDFDKWNIKDEYIGILENMRDYIKNYDYNVAIEGHTDSIGSDSYNMELSLKRAQSTKEKLIELGLEEERIVSVSGKGEEEPIATNQTNEGRAKNRRVEFHLEKR